MLSAYDMLKFDEGLRYKAYKDTVGKMTVGIGFNMDNPVAKGTWIHSNIPESFNSVYSGNIPLSTNSIISLFNTCVDWCRVDLESMFSDFEIYPDYVQLALINLMFNMGKSVLSQFNTFINLVKEHDYDGSSNDLASTKWSRELVQRSKRVCLLLKGDYSGYSACSSNPGCNSN